MLLQFTDISHKEHRPINKRLHDGDISVSIIGTAGLPARYGGFETLAENLVQNADSRIHYKVMCSPVKGSPRIPHFGKAYLSYIPFNANKLSSILYDLIGMLRSFDSDVMLILGVSGTVFLPIIRLFYRGKIIVNIDGMEWRRDKWTKLAKIFLRVSECLAVFLADKVIADNQAIVNYVQTTYGRISTFIPYGGDHTILKSEWIIRGTHTQERYAICVCRIEPENNVHMILEAFKNHKGLPIVFIGNWTNSHYGRQLYETYNKTPSIILKESIYDPTILDLLRANAYLYVHGHSAGGTNPSLVEAMHIGLPIFAFDVNFNRNTTKNACLYFRGTEALSELLDNLESAKLGLISKQMKSIADKRYIWANITKQYEKLYFS